MRSCLMSKLTGLRRREALRVTRTQIRELVKRQENAALFHFSWGLSAPSFAHTLFPFPVVR
jgi:hypothetical protein